MIKAVKNLKDQVLNIASFLECFNNFFFWLKIIDMIIGFVNLGKSWCILVGILVQAALVICGLFICDFVHMRSRNSLFSGTYPLIYNYPWSFYVQICYIWTSFTSPYLSNITRSTCTWFKKTFIYSRNKIYLFLVLEQLCIDKRQVWQILYVCTGLNEAL